MITAQATEPVSLNVDLKCVGVSARGRSRTRSSSVAHSNGTIQNNSGRNSSNNLKLPGAAPPLPLPSSRTSTAAIIEKVCQTNPFRNHPDLPEVPMPTVPIGIQVSRLSALARLRQAQTFIEALQYNHLPKTFFNINKHRPLSHILHTCREMVRECLPIRCIEASFLAIYLTQDLRGVDRYPVAFTSLYGEDGNAHMGEGRRKEFVARHIVMVVHCRDRWGALGLSRRSELMYKPLVFESMADVLKDFVESYGRCHHRVKAIHIGLPVSHDSTDARVPLWRLFSIPLLTKRQQHMSNRTRSKHSNGDTPGGESCDPVWLRDEDVGDGEVASSVANDEHPNEGEEHVVDWDREVVPVIEAFVRMAGRLAQEWATKPESTCSQPCSGSLSSSQRRPRRKPRRAATIRSVRWESMIGHHHPGINKSSAGMDSSVISSNASDDDKDDDGEEEESELDHEQRSDTDRGYSDQFTDNDFEVGGGDENPRRSRMIQTRHRLDASEDLHAEDEPDEEENNEHEDGTQENNPLTEIGTENSRIIQCLLENRSPFRFESRTSARTRSMSVTRGPLASTVPTQKTTTKMGPAPLLPPPVPVVGSSRTRHSRLPHTHR